MQMSNNILMSAGITNDPFTSFRKFTYGKVSFQDAGGAGAVVW
jgi:hypothetical protein